jgi:septum formation topological specificity factor MinE
MIIKYKKNDIRFQNQEDLIAQLNQDLTNIIEDFNKKERDSKNIILEQDSSIKLLTTEIE